MAGIEESAGHVGGNAIAHHIPAVNIVDGENDVLGVGHVGIHECSVERVCR